MKKVLAIALVFALCAALAACSAPAASSAAASTPAPERAASSSQPAAGSPFQVTASAQSIGLEGVINARQLGGYPAADGKTVKADVLLRTGKLDELTQEDIALLTDTYHLTQIIDLRTDKEIEYFPTPDIEGAEIYHLNVQPTERTEEITAKNTVETDEEPFEDSTLKMIQTLNYMGMARDVYSYCASGEEAKAAYKQFFNILLNNEGDTVLFHCYMGKDRTGVAAILLLSALGVDREIIKQDFLLTNVMLEDKINAAAAAAQKETDDPELIEYVRLMNGVGEPFWNFYFEEIDNTYGSMDKYLETEMGLGAEQLQALRDKYTV